MQRRRVRSAIYNGHADQNVIRRMLRVFRRHVVVAAFVEHACVHEFKLGLGPAAAAIFLDKLRVRKFRLRIFVEGLEIRMCGRGIEIKILLFHVLAVVALRPGQPEQPFLQNRIAPVPQRQRKAQPAFAVRDAQQSILAPAIRAAARVVVRKIIPARAVLRIILAHRAPLPLGKIRPPALPVFSARGIFLQPLGLGAGGRFHHWFLSGFGIHAAFEVTSVGMMA